MFNRKNKTISKKRKRSNQNPGVWIVFVFVIFDSGGAKKKYEEAGGGGKRSASLMHQKQNGCHPSPHVRVAPRGERGGTDPLRAPHTRDHSPPNKIL